MILFGLHMSLSLRKRFFGLYRQYSLKYFYDVNSYKKLCRPLDEDIKNEQDKQNRAEESLLVENKNNKNGSSLELDNELS